MKIISEIFQTISTEPAYQSFFKISTGEVKTFYQELRASLTVARTGNITVGANYQDDKIQELNQLFTLDGTQQLIGGNGFDAQNTQSAKEPRRFRQRRRSHHLPAQHRRRPCAIPPIDRSYAGCTKDNGDGQAAAAFDRLLGVNAQPGGCLTLNSNFQPALFVGRLNEDNVSWRGGLNYKPDRNLLLYANVSRGFKGGAFPVASCCHLHRPGAGGPRNN